MSSFTFINSDLVIRSDSSSLSTEWLNPGIGREFTGTMFGNSPDTRLCPGLGDILRNDMAERAFADQFNLPN